MNFTSRYIRQIIVLPIVVVAFLLVSCSKKQLPLSSVQYASVAVTAEMHQFINEGVERELKTGRKKPKHIIRTAGKYIGTPHCMGGNTQKCMDCSGLTYVSFSKNKIVIPRNSQEQARYGQLIFDKNKLKRGDLVFFTKSYKTTDYITHVGIYLGNNMFIHASSSAGVTKTPISNPWWAERFVFGTRVF